MPKSIGEETIKPERVTKKRASSSGAKETAVQRPRKVATKKATLKKTRVDKDETFVEETEMLSAADSHKARKAPTTFSAQKSAKKKLQINAVVVGIILLFGVGGSAVIGFSDEGQINVNQVIEARNERVKNNLTDGRDEVANSVTVPVQNTNNQNQVDGGLVGLGDRNVPVEATSTASESSATASSTETVASSSESTNLESEPEPSPEAETATE